MALTPKQPAAFDPTLAHITGEDGTIYQVLNKAGDDWDEEATAAEAAKDGAAVQQD